jgi:hypothetical protein
MKIKSRANLYIRKRISMLILAINIIESSTDKSGVMTDDEVCEVIRRSDDDPELFTEIIDRFSPLVHTILHAGVMRTMLF